MRSASTMGFLLRCITCSFRLNHVWGRLLRNAEDPPSDGNAPNLPRTSADATGGFQLETDACLQQRSSWLGRSGPSTTDLALLKTQELVQTGMGQGERERGLPPP